MISNNSSPTSDTGAGKGIAREGVGAILAWMVWKNLSKEVTLEQRPG